MPVRFLTDAQREQLSGFPAELDAEALDRFFTFSGADLAEIGRRHGDENQLGWALQLCGLRMLGFCPADVTTAPPGAVAFVARQLGVNPGELEGVRGPRSDSHGPHHPGEGAPGIPLGHHCRPLLGVPVVFVHRNVAKADQASETKDDRHT